MTRIRRTKQVWRHILTNTYFEILGAKITSADSRVFVVKENGGPERMFFADDAWDVSFVEREATFKSLEAGEEARIKNKRARDKASENRRYAESWSQVEADEPENGVHELDLTRTRISESEPEHQDEVETVDQSDVIEESEDHESLPEAEREEELEPELDE